MLRKAWGGGLFSGSLKTFCFVGLLNLFNRIDIFALEGINLCEK